MERLTCVYDGESALKKCCMFEDEESDIAYDFRCCNDICEEAMEDGGCQACPIQGDVSKLAAYESTGLSPEQIIRMDKMYRELCEKNKKRPVSGMNGYIIMAESYRKLAEQGEISGEEAGRIIEIYEFLATCNEDDLCKMVDSSAFNDIIWAFLQKVIADAGIPDRYRKKLQAELRYLYNGNQAKEVLNSVR